MQMPASSLKIGMIGLGVVGTGVAKLLFEQQERLAKKAGRPLELTKIAVRDPSKPRDINIPDSIITSHWEDVVNDPSLDVVVELAGGTTWTKKAILDSLASGKHIVTANKALLAAHGAHLHKLAEDAGVDLYYEAAVAGAIPLLRPLRESLSGDKVTKILGIVNGTTNFILSKMYNDGAAYETVLKEAQDLGYAESDPTADVEGFDSAAKAAILAGLAFHTNVTAEDVYREGMTKVTADDIAAAKSLGYVIKLLAIAELTDDEKGIIVRVHPSMIPVTHPLASVRDAFNAVFVEAHSAGEVMFYGRGAGGAPTASSVVGDIVAAARNRLAGSLGPAQSIYADLELRPIGEAKTSYYLNLKVADESGVLAAISNEFAKHDVSIQAVRQDGEGDAANLIIRTHQAPESRLRATVEALENMKAVREVLGVMRVEGAGA
jgi:homoserine dehydrogenase